MKSHFISRLIEVAFLFLKLGTIGFGGPAAHTAMMHNEVVTRRKWMDDQTFLDLLGATQLIPGPNSTEMASHIGFDDFKLFKTSPDWFIFKGFRDKGKGGKLPPLETGIIVVRFEKLHQMAHGPDDHMG